MWEAIRIFFAKNWKTTLAGVLIGVLTALQQAGKINAETYTAILGVLAALGFVAAKDGNKTGV